MRHAAVKGSKALGRCNGARPRLGSYQTIITEKVTLALTDDSDAEKLLGIQVDMRHEGED